MDFKNLSVFNVADQKLRYLSAKQKTIAENIANASTPNYLARDVAVAQDKNPAFSLKITNPKHLSLQKDAGAFYLYTPAPTEALTIDGNGVILEDQMNKASKASSEYKKTITIFNKYKTLLQTANTKINA